MYCILFTLTELYVYVNVSYHIERNKTNCKFLFVSSIYLSTHLYQEVLLWIRAVFIVANLILQVVDDMYIRSLDNLMLSTRSDNGVTKPLMRILAW